MISCDDLSPVPICCRWRTTPDLSSPPPPPARWALPCPSTTATRACPSGSMRGWRRRRSPAAAGQAQHRPRRRARTRRRVARPRRRALQMLAGNRLRGRLGADRTGLCRPPVRQLRAAARRWPRRPAGRGRGPPTAGGATSSSRAPGRRRSRGAATGARRWGRCCANIIVSEAMAALGIPTTRSLAAVTTGEPVIRETALPGAVLTRVASSHIRVGTFQFFAARGDVEALAPARRPRHRSALPGRRRRAAALSRAVRARDRAPGRARRAMDAGGLHPRRHEHRQHARSPARPSTTAPAPSWTPTIPRPCSARSITAAATPTANQPRIAHWNLARFGETLLPLLADDTDAALAIANEALGAFQAPLRRGADRRHAAQARPVHRGGGRRRRWRRTC